MIFARLLAGSLAMFLTVSTLPAAPAKKKAAAPEGDWIVIPEGFMASYLAIPAGEPKQTHRVIVDVPPSATAKASHPKVTRSSGDTVIDGIAVHYVQTILRMDKNLVKNLAAHTLAFQLEIRPYMAQLQPPMPRPAGTSPDAYLTPRPSYPYYARVHESSGVGRFRVTYGPNGGRPREVAMVKSTGSEVLDANSILFALNYWEAPNPSPRRSFVKEIEYSLRHGDGYYGGSFSDGEGYVPGRIGGGFGYGSAGGGGAR